MKYNKINVCLLINEQSHWWTQTQTKANSHYLMFLCSAAARKIKENIFEGPKW